jgi:WD40 repeat protein
MRNGFLAKITFLFTAAAVAASFAPACTQAPATATQAPTAPDFAKVASILQANCLGCHNSTAKMGDLVMESYESLMRGGAKGADIAPGKSDDSRLVMLIEGKQQPRMPFGGKPLADADIALIRAWINAGAKGPAAGETTTLSSAPAIPDIKPTTPVVSPVSAIAFSPDSRVLALGGYKQVRLIDAPTGRQIAVLGGHAQEVRALAFSPDGKWLAAAGGLPARSGEIKLWDLATHELLRTIVGHKDCIYAVAVSPDSKLLASGSYDKLVKLWDPANGKEIRTLKDHIDAVFSVAFSPDGKRLASGAQDRTVKIWDVATGQRLFTLSDALDGVTSLAFRPPGGAQIAAASADKQIRTWNLAARSGELAQSMIAHEDTVLQVAYTRDGKFLITTAADKTIRVWDADTLYPVRVLEPQSDWVQSMAVSPDGKWLAAGRYDGSFTVYDLKTFKPEPLPVSSFQSPVKAGITASNTGR